MSPCSRMRGPYIPFAATLRRTLGFECLDMKWDYFISYIHRHKCIHTEIHYLIILQNETHNTTTLPPPICHSLWLYVFEYCYTSSIATGCQSLRLSIADYEIGLQKISNSIWIRIQPRFFLVTTATTAATTTRAATATAGRTDSHCSKLSKFRWFAVKLYEIWTRCKFHCVLSYCHYMLELLLLLLLLLFNGILLSNVWISLIGASSAGAFLLGVLEHEDDEELLPVFFLPILVNSNNCLNGVLKNFVLWFE